MRKKKQKIEEISFNSCLSQREKQKTKHAANQNEAGMKTGTKGIAVPQAGTHTGLSFLDHQGNTVTEVVCRSLKTRRRKNPWNSSP